MNKFLNAIPKNSILAAICYPELGLWLMLLKIQKFWILSKKKLVHEGNFSEKIWPIFQKITAPKISQKTIRGYFSMNLDDIHKRGKIGLTDFLSMGCNFFKKLVSFQLSFNMASMLLDLQILDMVVILNISCIFLF